VITEKKKSKTKTADKKAKQEKKRSKVDPIKVGKLPPSSDMKDDDEEDSVLYIGHLPKEFEEKDLINFLSQFGKVHNCRIARKIQTGNPKGYAFVRFGDSEVAKIVCDTLHGYFMGQQRLVCQMRPSHKSMFFNTDTVIAKRRLQKKLDKKTRNEHLANSEKLKQITSKLVSREQKKRKQLEAMGIEYEFPGYEQSMAEYQEQFASQDDDKGTKGKRTDSAGSEGSAKKHKKKRNVSIDSEGSSKKKKSKNSADAEEEEKRERSRSVDSTGSAKTNKARKENIENDTSEKKKNKKKRKDSIDSEGSAKKKRKHSDASEHSTETPKKSSTTDTRQTQTAVKKDKKKKGKKRRESAP
jgi:nucleolar protein 15